MASLAPSRGAADIDNTPTDVSPEQAALAAGPIIAAILSQLPVRQRCRLMSVNRAWRAAGDDPDVWVDLKLEQKRTSLVAVCRSGDLPLLRKRAKLFGFTAADVRAYRNLTIREAARNGHLAISQWLSAHYDLTQIDIREGYDSTLYLACENGHLEMTQWLVTHFNLTSAILRPCGLLLESCINGHLAIAQWIAKYFDINVDDGLVRLALRDACSRNHLPVVQWLVNHFGVAIIGAGLLEGTYIKVYGTPAEDWLVQYCDSIRQSD